MKLMYTTLILVQFMNALVFRNQNQTACLQYLWQSQFDHGALNGGRNHHTNTRYTETKSEGDQNERSLLPEM
jgi:hypothetical protein